MCALTLPGLLSQSVLQWLCHPSNLPELVASPQQSSQNQAFSTVYSLGGVHQIPILSLSPSPYCCGQSRLQTQLKTLRIEMEEAKAQGTQMGLQNGELTGGLGEGRLEEGVEE